MSKDIGRIHITFPFQFTFENWASLINAFEMVGYKLQKDSSASIQYLPIGVDFSDYDWHFEYIDKDKLIRIIEGKVRIGEQIGFCLSPSENPSDDMIVSNQQSQASETVIAFYFSSASKVIDGGIVTDFSAYLKTIAPVCYIISKEFQIECHQYIDRM